MDNKHIYIFNGDPQTGKSDLSRLINTEKAIIIDDFVIPGKEDVVDSFNREVVNKMFSRKEASDVKPDNIILIVCSCYDDIYKLIKGLNESKIYEKYVISYLVFNRGDQLI